MMLLSVGKPKDNAKKGAKRYELTETILPWDGPLYLVFDVYGIHAQSRKMRQ
jgi:hypothetical protein